MASATDDKWAADPQDLTMWEMSQVLKYLGCKLSEIDEHELELMGLSAVLIRRRTDPSVELDQWRELKFGQLDIPDHEDTEDPTSPHSVSGVPWAAPTE